MQITEQNKRLLMGIIYARQLCRMFARKYKGVHCVNIGGWGPIAAIAQQMRGLVIAEHIEAAQKDMEIAELGLRSGQSLDWILRDYAGFPPSSIERTPNSVLIRALLRPFAQWVGIQTFRGFPRSTHTPLGFQRASIQL